ncbi:type II toxin-antitoxin system VapC family toxin [Nocardioides nitrophenolicus]|uniref:type II toxin-antitoxin system VapC family toxin n=1 Tax=Nocardioides nitrophenolicus TaxID=60489 RepID=UPI0027DDA416|nr:type II toxin-antitoxin system VapC family toxin [Nocardioides nitrophenolicus]MBM7517434.1 ribonuclease VapC [Nocardioides nitrophenolicus]
MIAVDTSALVAIVLGEPELERFSAILSRGPAMVSSASLTEAAMVLHARQGSDAVQDLHLLVQRAELDVQPVDAELAWAAHAAWVRFGKGRHPAGLNYGDCFSYALAKTHAVPLLFKGADFTQTDLTPAG